MERSALCRSRRELSKEYLLAKIGVDTAENEPLEVWGKIQFIIHLPPSAEHRAATRGAGCVCASRRSVDLFCVETVHDSASRAGPRSFLQHVAYAAIAYAANKK